MTVARTSDTVVSGPYGDVMKIKPGVQPGVDAAEAMRGSSRTSSPAKAGFDAAVGPEPAQLRPLDPVSAAVDDVAAAVARGELSRGEPAVHAVIDRIVRQSMGGPGADGRVDEACRMLGDDPAFVARVERMIDRSLAGEGR